MMGLIFQDGVIFAMAVWIVVQAWLVVETYKRQEKRVKLAELMSNEYLGNVDRYRSQVNDLEDALRDLSNRNQGLARQLGEERFYVRRCALGHEYVPKSTVDGEWTPCPCGEVGFVADGMVNVVTSSPTTTQGPVFIAPGARRVNL